jgi:hypothetical protein
METRVEKGENNLAGFWDKPLQDLLRPLPATPVRTDWERGETAVASLWPEQHGAGVTLRRFAYLPSPCS